MRPQYHPPPPPKKKKKQKKPSLSPFSVNLPDMYIKTNDHRERVTPMLECFNWPTLQCRRQPAKAAMMYRIVNGLVAIPADEHLTPIQNRTRGHGIRFLRPHTRIQAYKHSFFPSAIKIWNTLPQDLTSRPSLESFRAALSPRQPCRLDHSH